MKFWEADGGRHLASFQSGSPYSEASSDYELVIVPFIDAKPSSIPSGRNFNCIEVWWVNKASKLRACMCTRGRARARTHTHTHTHTYMINA